MAGYNLTIRQGSKVTKANEPTLQEALARLQAEAERIADQADLPSASAFKREYGPAQRVAGRVEISGGGLLRRSRDAGVDIMGDGSLVPFSGWIIKKPIDPLPGQSVFEAVLESLDPR